MKNSKRYYVYKHTTPANKVYIGITCINPSHRWNNGKGYQLQLFGKAVDKYGWNNIKHEILFDSLTKEEAEQKEIELIAFYKSNQKEYGYNVSSGGENIHNGACKYRGEIIKENFKCLTADGRYLILECQCCGRIIKRNYGCITGASKIICPCMRKHTPKNERTPRQYHFIEYKGEMHTATEWSKILGIDRSTIIGRHKKGYDIAKGNTARHKACVVCGKMFVPKKRNAGLCCSSECAKLYVKKEKPKAICKQCGKEFTIGRGSRGLYCSRECQWQSMRKI